MKTYQTVLTAVTMLLFTLLASVAIADNPENITTPDRHSLVAKGKVGMFRVNMENYGIGNGKDKVNADVLFSLDSDPKQVYIINVKPNSPPNNMMMADVLREAYFNRSTVTVYHQAFSERSNYHKIHLVELNGYGH